MRPLRCAPAALLWLALLAGSTASAAPARAAYALIIANNMGTEPKQAPLRYADDDGARYYELLSSRTQETVLLSVLDAETQALHPGLAARTRPPTRTALKEALRRLNARMAEDKIAAMEKAGVRVSPSPAELGKTLDALLKELA